MVIEPEARVNRDRMACEFVPRKHRPVVDRWAWTKGRDVGRDVGRETKEKKYVIQQLHEDGMCVHSRRSKARSIKQPGLVGGGLLGAMARWGLEIKVRTSIGSMSWGLHGCAG